MKQNFVNKKCKLVKANSFTLYGEVIEQLERGVVFKTTQNTSFINWNDINELVVQK